MSPSFEDPLLVRAELPEDAPAIRRINEAAFGRTAEAGIVDVLRTKGAVILSMVAVSSPAGCGEAEGLPVAHALFSPVTIGTGNTAAAAVGMGPVAVLPEWQGQGVGTMLVETSLEILRMARLSAVVVLGHARFYARFGFLPAKEWGLTLGMDVPQGAFMVLELQAGALAGTAGEVRYRPEFSEG